MSSARTSEPHHRASLVERHPGVLHQRAGRPRQGRHVGGAAAPQVELEAGFVQGFPELRLHQLRNRRHGQRVPTRFVQKYTVRARLDPARGSAGFRSSLSSSREDDQGANTAAPPRRPRGRRRRPLPPPRRRRGSRRRRDSRLSCAPPCRVTTSATGRQSYRRANQKPERAKVHRRGRARPPAETGQPPVVCPRPAGRRWPRTAGRAPAQVHVDHAPASATARLTTTLSASPSRLASTVPHRSHDAQRLDEYVNRRAERPSV